jgi:hypothetical protein
MLGWGCSNDNAIVQTDNGLPGPLNGSSLLSLPAGAVLDSAFFSIYAYDVVDPRVVSAHRILGSWDELTVTWNNFGSNYDAAVVGTFNVTGAGWYSIDITTLAQGWYDGTYDNYGLLIEDDEFNLVTYHSSEYVANPALRPKMTVYYTYGSPQMFTIQEGFLGETIDAWIWERYPDYNGGWQQDLYTGLRFDKKKLCLIQFDYELLAEYAALGDFVWLDNDWDGIQDPGEPGYPDVTVHLYMCDATHVATTTTDGNGYYLFDQLVPGDYYVRFMRPEAYDFSPQDVGGDDTIDSDADISTGFTICTNLEGGETDLTWDAGLYLWEPDGCTLTIGFWKTHGGFGPQADVVTQYLPIWLGDAGGLKSFFVDNGVFAHDILMRDVYGNNKNGITKLYAQMLGAKLNIAAGADMSAVSATIAAADAFLANYDWTDWDSLSKAMKSQVIDWMSDFDDYNNGDIGPGHCDDING